ncbi:hypothetical protein R3P38DRAFT_2905391 [Favolaschia claudopus]|uniref:ABM domain-containing protein n=1 Tax=Favolaschia claudopus TaxID=2862362 RepID=A0AAW0CHN1_9AGAR
MPITEIVAMDLLIKLPSQSPPLIKYFQTLAHRQSAYSAYPVLFFTDVRSPGKVYIISGWHDVESSYAWLGSPERLEIMKLLEPFQTIQSRIYVDIDFDNIPRSDVLRLKKQDSYEVNPRGAVGIGAEGSRALPLCHWEACGQQLDTETTTWYTIQIFNLKNLKALNQNDNSVSMQRLSLSG